MSYSFTININIRYLSATAIPLQAWTGPEGPKEDETTRISTEPAYEGGKVVSPKHRQPLPHQELSLLLISVRGWVNPRAVVRPEALGFYKTQYI